MFWGQAGAHQRATYDRARRSNERIRSMIHVEQSGLRTFEQN